jgi:hypothetical protein
MKPKSLRFAIGFIGVLTLFAGPLHAQPDPLREEFISKGGYQAYLAANLSLFTTYGINDEQKAFEHWKNFGRGESRSFDQGRLRTDRADRSADPNYAIDGGFCWEYMACGHPYKSVVFITKDAPKPSGWDGRALLLQKGDLFNLGPDYTAAAYRQLNSDVANAIDGGWFPSFLSVTDHYVKYGFKEGRLTNGNWSQEQKDVWNDDAYFTANSDVRSFFIGAQSEGWKLLGKIGFAHYINFGSVEGREAGQLLTAPEMELRLKRGFDEVSYRLRNPDVIPAINIGFYTSAHDHFDQGGKCEFAKGNLNRRPNDFLDNSYYLAANPDVVNLIADGFYATSWDHWRLKGAQEGRPGLSVEAGFDSKFYASVYPEISEEIGAGKKYPTALIHYLRKGQSEQRNPNSKFDESAYRSRNPDIANLIQKGTFTSAFDHFQRFGKFEFEKGNKLFRSDEFFDPAFYLSNNPDVKDAIAIGTYATAWDHWRMVGVNEGRAGLQIQAGFDEVYYLSKYPELSLIVGVGKTYPNAFAHFVLKGQNEQRNPNANFDESYYVIYHGLQDDINSKLISSGYDHYQRYGKIQHLRTLRTINGGLNVGAGDNDYDTIQDAINAAFDGEEVRIPAGIYTNGSFGIFEKNLTITGAGRGKTILEPITKIDPAVVANTGGGVALVVGTSLKTPTVNIFGVTFRNGDNRFEAARYKVGIAGALTVRNAKVHLNDCEFLNNKSFTGGALIFEDSSGSTISNCVFKQNEAQRDGGAIAAFKNGLESVVNCIFENNTMEQRGYNYVHDGNTGIHKTPGFRSVGVPYVADSLAKDGEFFDRFDTGAFRLVFQKVTGPAFFGFYAGPLGGAIALSDSSPYIKGNLFKNNRADFAGGGVYLIDGARPIIDSNTFDSNQSSRGAAIYSESGPVSPQIINNTIINNIAQADSKFPGSGKGAGIALYHESKPLIQGNYFENNWAAYGGGGIGIYEDSSATIKNNTFVNNGVSATNISGTIPASDGINTLLEFGTAAGGTIEVEVGHAIIMGNSINLGTARKGGGISVVGTASITQNSFSNCKAVLGAVGTFPGDSTLIGSAIYLFHPEGAPKSLRVSVSGNTFGLGNSPQDIVMISKAKADLPLYFLLTSPLPQ